MGSTMVELTRTNHENIERYIRAVCEELDDHPRNFRDNTAQLHRVNTHLQGILESRERLIKLYEDKDGSRRDEINAVAGSGPNLYSMFYERLRDLKDYHRRFPGIEVELPEDQIYVNDDQVLPQFTGEEAWGSSLDLHDKFERFINLRGVKRVDYLTYLDMFYKFTDDNSYKGSEYKEYIKTLVAYLKTFLERSQPLQELQKQFKEIEEKFNEKWNSGEFKGWKGMFPELDKMDVEPSAEKDRKSNTKNKQKENREKERDRDATRSEEKNEKDKEKPEKEGRKRDRDGKEKRRKKEERKHKDEREKREDRKEEEQQQEKEKEGGGEGGKEGEETATTTTTTVAAVEEEQGEQEEGKKEEKSVYCSICKKSFAKATVYEAHLKGKKHKTMEERGKQQSIDLTKMKDVFENEWFIFQIVTKYLMEQLANTKTNIEKKQSKTWEEMKKEWEAEKKAQELVEKGEEVEDESEEEPEIKMTIDNYPVGWDGKPIPYWLYKLHGLGVEYRCEICGNTSYMGRKAYEKHFQEWRHAHGMRCLGIPNSKHFHDITKINDALQLWDKIKYDNAHADWRPEADEEFEDKEGNVFNKKTYEDLKRQNLL